MYRHCIHCSADLGANEAVEAFPVGRRIAFDAAKGRLWAVCPRCARWNLSPIEERWEAVEAAEKLFADARLRVQKENIGVVKLRDGTRLVRVGAALPRELAAWRFAGELSRRRRLTWTALGLTITASVVKGVVTGGILSVIPVYGLYRIWSGNRDGIVHSFRGVPGGNFDLTQDQVGKTRIVPSETGEGFDLHVPVRRTGVGPGPDGKPWHMVYDGFAIVGEPAVHALRRAMPGVNRHGGTRRATDAAVELVAESGPEAYLRQAAGRRARIDEDVTRSLALEMALNEESERRALEGELALLEAAWREAEEIAGIADGLASEHARPPPPGAAG